MSPRDDFLIRLKCYKKIKGPGGFVNLLFY
jgi:hypothetical protein